MQETETPNVSPNLAHCNVVNYTLSSVHLLQTTYISYIQAGHDQHTSANSKLVQHPILNKRYNDVKYNSLT